MTADAVVQSMNWLARATYRDKPPTLPDFQRPKRAPLTAAPSVVVISDRVEEGQQVTEATATNDRPWPAGPREAVDVCGSYLERLPLALIASGIVEQAEIWHHMRGPGQPSFERESACLARRAFRLDDNVAPFASSDMMAFIRTYGAPDILIIYGLGVAPEILALCAASLIVYNSIDAPSLRVPAEVSAHFDLVLTGAEWQSAEVTDRHPGKATAVLPVGPEFAGVDQFRPLGSSKDYDLIYVAAAQAYKRHDILFDALARLPRDIRALCVFGYGEDADALRARATAENLSIDFVGPPGVPIDEVNRLMNRARFGVVCGVEDGAPAILTEYMLAGLPVLANEALACGLQYIRPDTGMTASAEDFADAIMTMRATYDAFSPREAVLSNWTWPHSLRRLAQIVSSTDNKKKGARRFSQSMPVATDHQLQAIEA